MCRHVSVLSLCLISFTIPSSARGDFTQYDATILYGTGTNQPFVGPGGVAAGTTLVGSHHDATIWSPNGTPTLLDNSLFHDSSITDTGAGATDGTQLVGAAALGEAIYWNSATGAVAKLNPAGAGATFAEGLGGNQQVGDASFNNGPPTPLLWTGSAASAVILAPRGIAYATDGSHQVGTGGSPGTGGAALWSGTASSLVNLGPTNLPNLTPGVAWGVSNGQEVGYADTVANQNLSDPLLWHGSDPNAIDLTPVGFNDGWAIATNGVQQVGTMKLIVNGFVTVDDHAFVWTGTATSAVDLQQFLPSTYTLSSASTIDATGDVFGTAQDAAGNWYVVEWSSVPEPSTGGLMLLVLGLLLWRRGRSVSIGD